jgi:hypothetical protein
VLKWRSSAGNTKNLKLFASEAHCQQPNNPGAADGIKILVVMQRLSAAADQERWAASNYR